MNENEEKIYDLIGSKAFAELTEAEKVMVLDSLGSEELYGRMREANQLAEEELTADIPPPPEMKKAVMDAFDNPEQERGIVWWKYAAAVAVLVVGAIVFWPSGNADRSPLAENVERKEPSETKKEPESKAQAPLAPVDESSPLETETTPRNDALSNVTEVTEEETIAEIETINPAVEVTDDTYRFEGNEMEVLAEMEPDEESLEIDAMDSEYEDTGVNAPTASQVSAAEETLAQNADDLTETLSPNKSVRAATNGAKDSATSGISLQDIGGYAREGYVAY